MSETQESNPIVTDYLLGPPSNGGTILVAPCENCVKVKSDKSEMWRIRRELKTLLDRIDKLILSQD